MFGFSVKHDTERVRRAIEDTRELTARVEAMDLRSKILVERARVERLRWAAFEWVSEKTKDMGYDDTQAFLREHFASGDLDPLP